MERKSHRSPFSVREYFCLLSCFSNTKILPYSNRRLRSPRSHNVPSRGFSRSHIVWVAIITLLWVPLLTLSGCAGICKKLEPPRITLANILVQEVQVFESVFQIELRVFNTNDVSLEIRGLDCELALNQRHFASGVSDIKTTIPPYGTAKIPIVVYSSVIDVVRGVIGLQDNENLRYDITGHLRLEGGPTLPSSIPFKSEGEITLKRDRGQT
jgi:LEA14-like dessication related protein